MKRLTGFGLLAISASALAHHTKEHTMAMQPPQQVIAETRQGEGGYGMVLLWLVVALVFALGLWNWLKPKNRK